MPGRSPGPRAAPDPRSQAAVRAPVHDAPPPEPTQSRSDPCSVARVESRHGLESLRTDRDIVRPATASVRAASGADWPGPGLGISPATAAGSTARALWPDPVTGKASPEAPARAFR